MSNRLQRRTSAATLLLVLFSLTALPCCGRAESETNDDTVDADVDGATDGSIHVELDVKDPNTCPRVTLPLGATQFPFETGCRTDADCTVRPGGTCIGRATHFCRPQSPDRSWDPALEQGEPCVPVDAPTAMGSVHCAPGEVCFQWVVPSCIYDECEEDAECAAGERCACDPQGSRCVWATCRGDEDCPVSERCLAVPNFCRPYIGGYACTTPNDECTPHVPCECDQEGYCFTQPGESAWRCTCHTCR